MNFQTVLGEIFDRGAYTPFQDADDERVAIAKAKLGDSDATISLFYAYAPALRNALVGFRHAGGAWSADNSDTDDLRAAAAAGMIEAIAAFDGERWQRLAALVPGKLAEALAASLSGPVAFSVPQRTLTRFYAILRHAEGNVYEAAKIAPDYEMKRETFLAVLSAIRNVDSLDEQIDGNANTDGTPGDWSFEAQPIWDNSAPDAEDAVLVEAAFAVVDTLEKDVTRLAYGFTEYDPVPDAEIGARLLLSRQKVQRTRSAALGKMRDALGAA